MHTEPVWAGKYEKFGRCRVGALSAPALINFLRPMNRLLRLLATLILICHASFLYGQGTAFTYQGRLNDGPNPANGRYDFQFAVFDNSTNGSQQGPSLTNAATAVSNGLFIVTLDLGNQFPGADRWLEISVCTNGGGSFITLNPRQPLLPTPYAITAANVMPGGIPSGIYTNAVVFSNTNSQFAGNGSRLTDLTGNGAGLTNLNIPSYVVTNGQSGVALAGSFNGNGGGLTNCGSTVFYDSFGDKHGTPMVANSGQSWIQFALSNSFLAVITNGELTTTVTNAVAVACHNYIQMPRPIVRMAADFQFEPFAPNGTNVSSALALVGWPADFGGWFTNNPSNPIPNTDAHVVFQPTQVAWGFWTNSTYTSLYFSWANAFTMKPGATYHVEVWKYNGYGIILGPDGVAYRVIDARIGTTTNYYADFENYQNDASTELRVGIKNPVADCALTSQSATATLGDAASLVTQLRPFGITTNVSIAGITFYITNGLIMRVSTP